MIWNLLSFVWNDIVLYGNYDFGMDYWTLGLLYGFLWVGMDIWLFHF